MATLWVRQGCILSPPLFSIVLDDSKKNFKKWIKKLWHVTLENEKNFNLRIKLCRRHSYNNWRWSNIEWKYGNVQKRRRTIISTNIEILRSQNIWRRKNRWRDKIKKIGGSKLCDKIKHSFLGRKEIPKDIWVRAFEEVVTP